MFRNRQILKPDNDAMEAAGPGKGTSTVFGQRPFRINQALIETFPGVALLLQPDHTIMAVNPGGHQKGARRGRFCYEIGCTEPKRCADCLMGKAFSTEKPQSLCFKQENLQQAIRWIPLGSNFLMVSGVESGTNEKFHFQQRQVKAILRYAAQHNGGDCQPRPINLNALVQNCLTRAQPLPAGIRVFAPPRNEAWLAYTKPDAVEAVMLQLIRRACRGMSSGGSIYINLRNFNSTGFSSHCLPTNQAASRSLSGGANPITPGSYVKMTIADSGSPGKPMPTGTTERRSGAYATTVAIDTPDDFDLTSAFAELNELGGAINAYSHNCAGRIVSFYLPPFEDPDQDSHATVRGSATCPVPSILLVDDDEIVLEVGSQLLQKMGYRVLTAANGSEALKIYRREPRLIDLVILDMIMPVLNGSATYARLKEADPNVKVLLSSGYGASSKVNRMLEQGCLGFLSKPYSMEQIAFKIEEALATT